MIQEIHRRVAHYLERGAVYYSNFEHERQLGDKGKASEELWGVICSLLNAYHVLLQGKPIGKHSELSKFAESLLLSQPDGEELYKTFRNAEKLHANFYHMFLADDELNEIWARVQQLATKIESMLKTELAKVESSI